MSAHQRLDAVGVVRRRSRWRCCCSDRDAAMVVAVAGAWTQCTFKVKRPYPLYRTVFSMAAEAITMQATGLVYVALGGLPGPTDLASICRSRWSARLPRTSSSTPAWWPAPLRCRRGSPCGRSGTTTSSGAGPASWWPAAPARSAAVVDRARRVLAGHPDARAGLSDLSHLPALPRPHRRSAAARRRDAEAARATRSRRCCRRDGRSGRSRTKKSASASRCAASATASSPPISTARVLLINNAAEALTGWSQDEALGTAARARVPEPRSRNAEALRSARRAQRRNPGQPGHALHGARRRDLTERPIEEMRRAASRCRRPHDRDGAGVPRHQRRAQDAGGARQGRQARLARPAGGRHRPRLQQHPDGDHGQRLDGARDDAGRWPRCAALAEARTSLRPRAAADVAAADVLQGRRAGQEDRRRCRACSRKPPRLALARLERDAARFDIAPDLWPSTPTRRSSCRCSPTC